MTPRTWRTALLAGCACLSLAACATAPSDEQKQGMDTDSRLRVALAAEGSGDRDLAISMYLAAAEASPNDTVVQQRCAEGLARNGRLDEAEALLTRGLKEGARRTDLLETLGSIEVLAGQAVQAEAAFSQILAAKPDDVRAMANKGIALDLQHRHAEAQALYHKALTLAPNDAAISNDLALSLLLSGHREEARQVLLPFRDAAGVPERLRINLGIVEAADGHDVDAQRLLGTNVDATDLAAMTQAIGATQR